MPNRSKTEEVDVMKALCPEALRIFSRVAIVTSDSTLAVRRVAVTSLRQSGIEMNTVRVGSGSVSNRRMNRALCRSCQIEGGRLSKRHQPSSRSLSCYMPGTGEASLCEARWAARESMLRSPPRSSA